MNIIISCHIDTVFKDPFLRWDKGILKGALDNFACVLASGFIMKDLGEGVHIEWTEDEEMYMDGARCLAKKYSQEDTLFIVMDVTRRGLKWNRDLHFTVENIHRVEARYIRKALLPLRGQYRILEKGGESEAWLYRDLGFTTIEIDIPVMGGLHSLDATTRLVDLEVTAEAIKLLIEFFKEKTLREIVESIA